ncbi:hypothetical protein LC087_06500 [Bacillus carboniphilus]|uniref:Uncharacterized protein n=1 Tax=Bacillus carboniphilus TaxID=86663 RepID=A0ABY9K1Q2_9BACI|nr:hypothetical protein [Bacillus carboniphilus]WLR43775.1 hypothetical protein LC087_06500 [Bacillus carboniphilus]
MKKSHWNDKEIESLLKQLPPLKDNQSKEKLFEKISERNQEKAHLKKEFSSGHCCSCSRNDCSFTIYSFIRFSPKSTKYS